MGTWGPGAASLPDHSQLPNIDMNSLARVCLKSDDLMELITTATFFSANLVRLSSPGSCGSRS